MEKYKLYITLDTYTEILEVDENIVTEIYDNYKIYNYNLDHEIMRWFVLLFKKDMSKEIFDYINLKINWIDKRVELDLKLIIS